jgi:hypothetical protein
MFVSRDCILFRRVVPQTQLSSFYISLELKHWQGFLSLWVVSVVVPMITWLVLRFRIGIRGIWTYQVGLSSVIGSSGAWWLGHSIVKTGRLKLVEEWGVRSFFRLEMSRSRWILFWWVFSLNLSKFMHCTRAERSIGLFCLFAEVVLVVVPMMTWLVIRSRIKMQWNLNLSFGYGLPGILILWFEGMVRDGLILLLFANCLWE